MKKGLRALVLCVLAAAAATSSPSPAGVVRAAGDAATLDPADTVGTWSIAFGTKLTIKSDQTYTWAVSDKETLTGTWSVEPDADRYRGPVRLAKGMRGSDWWVGYIGKVDGVPTIVARSEYATTYNGIPWKER